MFHRFLIFLAVFLGLVTMSVGSFAQPQGGVSNPQPPSEVLKSFLRAFVDFDYDTCRAYLAEGATILIVRRQQGGEFETEFLDANLWLDQVQANVKMLENFEVQFFDTATFQNGHGATVLLKARSTARAPSGAFTNNETSSAVMVPVEGEWKILQYSMFEDFTWVPYEMASE